MINKLSYFHVSFNSLIIYIINSKMILNKIKTLILQNLKIENLCLLRFFIMESKFQVNKLAEKTYELPIGFVEGMNVPCTVFCSDSCIDEEMAKFASGDHSSSALCQIAESAKLSGISARAYCMPDFHKGYGIPIGSVVGFDISKEDAPIIPGGVGYDINCGVRCIVTDITMDEFLPMKKRVMEAIKSRCPCGVGGRGKFVGLRIKEVRKLFVEGAKWAVDNGYGVADDLAFCEESGCLPVKNINSVPQKVIGAVGDLGTLGSGNHYIEVQNVEKIFEEGVHAAKVMGLKENIIVVMIHCGSRSVGHRLATEYAKIARKDAGENFDNDLYSFKFNSEIGQKYFDGMNAAANFAYCNRQVLTHYVREAFLEAFGESFKNRKMKLLYDVAHNIAKVEKHNGIDYIVIRKGATRAFGPNNENIPLEYRDIGQPVFVGGSMGTASYILTGVENEAFSTTCHGAGRKVSRQAANSSLTLDDIKKDLDEKGIAYFAAQEKTLVVESHSAYKDIDEVIDVCSKCGLSKRVSRNVPLCVLKG